MNDSEILNGYWEEGYHYYIEIRGDEMTVRNYMRKVALKTRISCGAGLPESGERTVIALENNVLSRKAGGEPYDTIRELVCENGELKFWKDCVTGGETLYTLKKVDHGPFDHIVIRDDEFLDFLQGEWLDWGTGGKGSVLTITGDRLSWRIGGAACCPFHVVSERGDPRSVSIVPADLTENSFSGFNPIRVLPDMLTTYQKVHDMSMPMTVFVREDMLDKVKVPDEAKTAPQSMMGPAVQMRMMMMGWTDGIPGLVREPSVYQERKKTTPKFCPECGCRVAYESAKYCTNCGHRL